MHGHACAWEGAGLVWVCGSRVLKPGPHCLLWDQLCHLLARGLLQASLSLSSSFIIRKMGIIGYSSLGCENSELVNGSAQRLTHTKGSVNVRRLCFHFKLDQYGSSCAFVLACVFL